MALTTRQKEIATSLRQTMEKELIKQINDNLNNKLSAALGTGILSFVSAEAERLIQELSKDSEGKSDSPEAGRQDANSV